MHTDLTHTGALVVAMQEQLSSYQYDPLESITLWRHQALRRDTPDSKRSLFSSWMSLIAIPFIWFNLRALEKSRFHGVGQVTCSRSFATSERSAQMQSLYLVQD